MVGLLIYVKKHCIRPEKIGKDTNQLIFQIQLILRMANDQDQVLVFNVVGGGTGYRWYMYVQSAAQRCGRKAVGYSYMYVVPGYYMCSTQRGGYIYYLTTGTTLVVSGVHILCHSQSQRYC